MKFVLLTSFFVALTCAKDHSKVESTHLSQAAVEEYFRQYLGVTHFIWLGGEKGLNITDAHIDGIARIANHNTIVTIDSDNFINPSEYDVLVSARDAVGRPYNVVHLPITQKTILNTDLEGTYVNYYVDHGVVLVPTFNDPMEQKAVRVLDEVYAPRRFVGINMEELYVDGGSIHCVTQQQPPAIRR